MAKTIILAGAPLPGSLSTRSKNLLDTFAPSIAEFAGLPPAQPTDTHPSPTQPHIAWYSLRPQKQTLENPFYVPVSTQQYQNQNVGQEPRANAIHLARPHLGLLGSETPGQTEIWDSEASRTDLESQFYDHSLRLHEDLPSSLIHSKNQVEEGEDLDGDGDGTTSFNTTTTTMTGTDGSLSYTTDSYELLSQSRLSQSHLSLSTPNPNPNPPQQPKQLPPINTITPLRDLPTATHLSSIHPQTITLTLITGIISITPPRSIVTRHGKSIEIVEMLVGDDTKSGFLVNFWLPVPSPNSAKPLREGLRGGLREALEGLRPRDVVLLRHVALSSFQGRVYGQSLRGEMTKVELLLRKRLDRDDRQGFFTISGLHGELNSEVERKTKRVWEWVLAFVGGTVKRGKRKRAVGNEGMPPDTPV